MGLGRRQGQPQSPQVLGPGSKMAGTLDQQVAGGSRASRQPLCCAVETGDPGYSGISLPFPQLPLGDLFPCLPRSPAVATQHSPLSLWMFFLKAQNLPPPSSLPTCQLLTPTPTLTVYPSSLFSSGINSANFASSHPLNQAFGLGGHCVYLWS